MGRWESGPADLEELVEEEASDRLPALPSIDDTVQQGVAAEPVTAVDSASNLRGYSGAKGTWRGCFPYL